MRIGGDFVLAIVCSKSGMGKRGFLSNGHQRLLRIERIPETISAESADRAINGSSRGFANFLSEKAGGFTLKGVFRRERGGRKSPW